MRVLALVLLAPLLVTPLAASPTHAAGETCQGRPATIVGEPGQDILLGTAGPDVVVTNGAGFTDAKEGDDLVCVSGALTDDEFERARVRGGPGDDEIHSGPDGADAQLGTGRDLFVGGDAKDVVQADDLFVGSAEVDDPDVVRTGGGDDEVEIGVPKQPLVDDVDLGPGDDDLGPYSRIADPSADLVGGPGSDELALGSGDYGDDPLATARWTFTNTVTGGVATAAGADVLSWTGFEEFDLLAPTGPLTFVGGPADEVLRQTRRIASVRMGGGNDMVSFQGSWLPQTLDGGPGRDVLRPGLCPGALVADLAVPRVRCTNRFIRREARPTGFEEFQLTAREATVRGTPRADRIAVAACRGTIQGRGGDDLLTASRTPRYQIRFFCPRTSPVRLLGGRGADRLRSGNLPQVLLGGPGFDRADGGAGRDRCVAERRTACER